MKILGFFLTILLLLTFATHSKAQEIQQIKVYINGEIFYTTNLTPNDSLSFDRNTEDIIMFTHVNMNGSVIKEIAISEIDSIIFSGFIVPGNPNADGVLINGTIWAICNVNMPCVFASHPTEFGMFYQWNRKVGWSTTNPMISSDGNTIWNSTIPTGNSWEPENNPCPTGWRLPTYQEQASLVNSGSFWGELNGVSGRYFGDGTQRVFFPAVGYRRTLNGELVGMGVCGEYWGERASGNESAYTMEFHDYYTLVGAANRRFGHSVRCVKE